MLDMTNKNKALEADVFTAIINQEFSELRTLTQEAQLEMDTEFSSLWDVLPSNLTEKQIEAICLLETERQEKAMNALVAEYFSSSN